MWMVPGTLVQSHTENRYPSQVSVHFTQTVKNYRTQLAYPSPSLVSEIAYQF